MEWTIRGDLPIYSQLVEQIRLAIVSGRMLPGEKIPSVRDLAAESGVNPNTMQRALQELERQGIIYTQRTAGRYVTEDTQVIARVKAELAEKQLQSFMSSMKTLGYSADDIMALIRAKEKEHADT